MFRFSSILGLSAVFSCVVAYPDPPVPVVPLPETTTIAEILRGYANGTLTVTGVVQFYLERIEKFDKSGPKLNSIIETDPDVLQAASNMDFRLSRCLRRSSEDRINTCLQRLGPLFGIPILVKDNIATTGKMQTAAGSLALVGSVVPNDATVVKRLKDAGGIILGKAGMTEWANYRSYGFPDGWSGRGGQVLNPHYMSPQVGGSSSGCGSAMAAHLAVVCIGTETSGSIISPSYEGKVPGLKPTPKTIPQDGIIPITADEDVAGPIGRNVNDVGLVWSILAGKAWSADSSSSVVKVGVVNPEPAVLQALERAPGIKIIPMHEVAFSMAGLGMAAAHFQCRFKEDLEDYLSTLKNTSIRTLNDIIEFNRANPDKERVDLGQTLLEQSLYAPTYKTSPEYCKQMKDQYRFEGLDHPEYGFNSLRKKYEMDVIVGNWPIIGMVGSFANYPVMHYPVGDTRVIAVGSGGREEHLLALGKALETIGTRPIPPLY